MPEPVPAPAPAPAAPTRILPRRSAPLLAVGRLKLGLLVPRGLEIWDSSSIDRRFEVPLVYGRGIGALSDGALLAVGGYSDDDGELCRFAPQAKDPQRMRASLPDGTGRTRVFPSRSPERVWLATPTSPLSLDEYQLDWNNGTAQKLDSLPIEGDAPALIQLTGGGFAHAAPGEIRRVGGAAAKLPEGTAPIVHLAPGPKAGQVWVLTEDNALVLYTLGAETATAGTQLPVPRGTPFALVADRDRVAVLLVDDEPGDEPRWTLVVRRATGETVMSTSLPFHPTLAEAADVHVAAGHDVLVISQGSRVVAWNLGNGRKLGHL